MAKLSYTDTGGPGEALLFLHGIMMSKEVWTHQITCFAENYRVIAVDLTGFGASPKGAASASFQDHAADIIALLDELKIRQAHLAGWSMGGVVAIILAKAYPHHVATITLIDTTPSFIARRDFPDAVPADRAAELLTMLRATPQQGVAAFVDMILPGEGEEKERALLLHIARQSDLQNTLDHFSHSAAMDLRPLLADIRQPALVVCGSLDQLCPPGASRFLAENLPRARLEYLDGAGHAPFLTVPDRFNDVLNNFLSQNRGQA